ncbi:MAG: methionyl-tRNA formyltransferase [Gammaproteobacteria bacterium]
MNGALRIIYAGTPDFAVPPLRALAEAGHDVIAVYTQPDRPSGRGRKLTPSPVKAAALDLGIEVRQPKSLRGAQEQAELEALNADLMVVAAYGLILPKAVLDAPRLGCVNIHASLLPRWRGAAPIQRAIAAGDEQTGITIMQMDEGLDTGAMLHALSCPIRPSDTGGSLHDTLMDLGARALMETLPDIGAGTTTPMAQDDSLATYARKLDKAEALVDWRRSADELERLIRAFNPWPVCQTSYRGKALRIWEASAEPVGEQGDSGVEPGRVIGGDKGGIRVACGSGVLNITRLQLPGKKSTDAASFLNAYGVEDTVLG